MTDSTGTTNYTYDELNRVKSKYTPNIDMTYYIYDTITNMPEGFIEQSIKDPKGNVTKRVFDRTGRLVEVVSETGVAKYSYYDNGNKKSLVYPDGTSEEYTYYRDNLLKTLTNKKADGTDLDTYSYTYDAAHNQLSKVETKGKTFYTYDVLNRLESVVEPNGKKTVYAFDKSGNRQAETVIEGTNTTVTSYSYNEQNRLIGTTIKTNGILIETTAYDYDNNGNQIKSTKTPYLNGAAQTALVTTNSFDELNQLTSTNLPENKIIQSTYNGEGKRVAKSVDGKTTNFVYENDKIVLELDNTGTQIARNVVGTSVISRAVDGKTAYYLYNGHADVVSLIGTDGQILAKYDYDAFGNPTETTGNIDNPYRYAGYQYDQETGMYYLMARMYDPETARFLQEDTYRGDINDPLSLNLYTYVHNEPLMYTDPTGHFRTGDTLSYDSTGEDVVKLQQFLEYRGYLVMPKDKFGQKVPYGTFADLTLTAVNKYKKDSNLLNTGQYKGKVGITTWKNMGLGYERSVGEELVSVSTLYTGPTYLVGPGGSAKSQSKPTYNQSNDKFEEKIKYFPESYRNKLRLLHEKHPQWQFEAYNTDVNFDDFVSIEMKQGGTVSDVWKHQRKPLSPLRDRGGYYDASRESVEYFIDPRNFLDENGIFQFLTAKYNPNTQNINAVNKVLEGSLLQSKGNAFIEAGGQDANAVFLAAKAMVESGGGTSTLATGRVNGYSGWFNMYGIGANDGNNSQVSGAKYAKSKGWNSQEKAIVGGGKWIYNNYVGKGQDTLYLMKWNIENYKYTGNVRDSQYATNIMDAYNKSTRFSKGLKTVDAPLTFRIPIFNNMK